MTLAIVVNGVRHEVPAAPDRSLLSVLRDELGLTGAKYACGEGECGACMVLLDGRAVPACRATARDAAAHAVTTIEGVADGDVLHPVQRAFVEARAFQCGFCAPGMITGAIALLAANDAPTDEEIRAALEKHLCRCGSDPRIVDAVHRAAAVLRAGRSR